MSQMYLRCTGNAGADMTHVVECVNCTIAAGADIAVWPTLSRLVGTIGEDPQPHKAPKGAHRGRPQQSDGDMQYNGALIEEAYFGGHFYGRFVHVFVIGRGTPGPTLQGPPER